MLKIAVVLNSPDVDAAITLVDRQLLIPGVPPIYYPLIDSAGPSGAVAAVAETLGVVTWTPGAWVADKEYQFNILQYDTTFNRLETYPVYYKTLTADANVTVVCNRMKAIIRKQIGAGLEVTVAADGAATIVITSAAGNHPFTVQDVLNGTSVVTTPFVHSVGAPDDVIAAISGYNGAVAADVNTATTYASVTISGYNKSTPVIGSADTQQVMYKIFADTGDAGTAAWITALNDLLAADDGAGAVPLGTVSIVT